MGMDNEMTLARRDELERLIQAARTEKDLDALLPFIRKAPFPFNEELGESSGLQRHAIRTVFTTRKRG